MRGGLGWDVEDVVQWYQWRESGCFRRLAPSDLQLRSQRGPAGTSSRGTCSCAISGLQRGRRVQSAAEETLHTRRAGEPHVERRPGQAYHRQGRPSDRPRFIPLFPLVPLASCPPKSSPMHRPQRDSRVDPRQCHPSTRPRPRDADSGPANADLTSDSNDDDLHCVLEG